MSIIQGLNPKEHLGKTLAEMRPILFKLVSYKSYYFVLKTFYQFLSYRQKNMVSMFVVKVENSKH